MTLAQSKPFNSDKLQPLIAIGLTGGWKLSANIGRAVFITFFLTQVNPAMAQGNPPPAVDQLLPGSSAKSVFYIDRLSSEQRDFFWKDTTSQPGGYFLIEEPSARVDFVKILLEHSAASNKGNHNPKENASNIECSQENSFAVEYVLRESAMRTTWLLRPKKERGRWAAYTLWHFADQGAKVVLAREFLNAKFDGKAATVSLSVKRTPHLLGLWKMSWLSEDKIQHEFYLEEHFDAGGNPLGSSALIEASALAARAALCLKN
jgi:hypothetical protein